VVQDVEGKVQIPTIAHDRQRREMGELRRTNPQIILNACLEFSFKSGHQLSERIFAQSLRQGDGHS